jgi:membrane protease YdiL (CAAX protease family)
MTFLKSVVMIITFFLLFVLLQIGFSHLPFDSTPAQLVINSLSSIGALIAVWMLNRFWDKQSICALGISIKGQGKHVILWSFVGAALVGLGFLVIWLFHALSFQGLNPQLTYSFIAILCCLLPAFGEELIFRGYIFTRFQQTMGHGATLLFSSLFFMLVHSLNPDVSFLFLWNVYLAGFLMGLIRLYTGSLWGSFGFHAFWNMAQLFFGFSVSGYDEPTFLLTKALPDNWISGGATGFEGSVVCTLLLSIVIGLYGRYGRRIPNIQTTRA